MPTPPVKDPAREESCKQAVVVAVGAPFETWSANATAGEVASDVPCKEGREEEGE
jgi:hypothetical protein